MQAILNNDRIKHRFISRVLHPSEISSEISAQFLASRWAAKEALVKALSDYPVNFREVCISKHSSGRPILGYEGSTLESIHKKGVQTSWLSISHEDEYAVATVILLGNL